MLGQVLAFLACCPTKKKWFTDMGRDTLVPYLFHHLFMPMQQRWLMFCLQRCLEASASMVTKPCSTPGGLHSFSYGSTMLLGLSFLMLHSTFTLYQLSLMRNVLSGLFKPAQGLVPIS